MKHILPIRGPNPKIFYFLIALCFVALCVPASATIAAPDSNPNLTAFHNYDYVLNSAATRAGNINPATAYMKEGNVYRATNSTWRRSCLNAAQSNSRTYYMNTTTGAIEATFPRRISAPLLT
jgi:hypothetical protein